MIDPSNIESAANSSTTNAEIAKTPDTHAVAVSWVMSRVLPSEKVPMALAGLVWPAETLKGEGSIAMLTISDSITVMTELSVLPFRVLVIVD